ncbi:MAG: hypothetical protein AB1847_19480 [bacterium]
MQTEVLTSMAIGLPGQLADISNCQIDSYVNGSKQLDEVTITAADAATTVTINGTAFTVNVAAAAKTKAELVALLIAAINAGTQPVMASEGSATDKMYIRADVHGTAFTAVGTTNCTVAHVVLNEATIPFGVLVVQDKWSGLDKTAHLPSLTAEITTASVPLGVTVHTQALEQAIAGATNVGYPAFSSMSVLRRGRIYVQVENAVKAGDVPYVRFSAGVGEQLGSFRSDADTADASILPYSRFVTSAGAGGIAILEVNLP